MMMKRRSRDPTKILVGNQVYLESFFITFVWLSIENVKMRSVPKLDSSKPAFPTEAVSEILSACVMVSPLFLLFFNRLKEEDLKWVEENLPTTTLDK